MDWINPDWAMIVREFVTILVVIDPIGSIPVYFYAVQSVPQRLHRRFAIRAVGVATVVLLAFLIGGQILIETLGLRLGSFQIAGGIVLFLFALTMIFGDTKAKQEIAEAEREDLSGAVYPLAIPSIASPGAMLAIVILTDNHTNSLGDQAITAGLLILVLVITLLVLLAASYIYRILGNTGVSIISRVMGLVLATIAVDAILTGFDMVDIIDVPEAEVGVPLDAQSE